MIPRKNVVGTQKAAATILLPDGDFKQQEGNYNNHNGNINNNNRLWYKRFRNITPVILFLGVYVLHNVLVVFENKSVATKSVLTTKEEPSLDENTVAAATATTANDAPIPAAHKSGKPVDVTSSEDHASVNTMANDANATNASTTILRRRPKNRSGHWERDAEGLFAPAYQYSEELCKRNSLHDDVCLKQRACYDPEDLMNWLYYYDDDDDNNNTKQHHLQPRFDADGFRSVMKNKRINFIGSSLMRQQVLALAWSLGVTEKARHRVINGCGSSSCFAVDPDNITICYTTLGRPLAKTYTIGNYTLYSNHSAFSNPGSPPCLLEEEYMGDYYSSFDATFVQSLIWYLGISRQIPDAPEGWIQDMLPTIYNDSITKLLTLLSKGFGSVHWVLGHTGTPCKTKTKPEPVATIPNHYGWQFSNKLWDRSLELLQEPSLEKIRILDVREPTMQSVHAHPSSPEDSPWSDCLHFCLASAALNSYLDIYWTDVFSRLE